LFDLSRSDPSAKGLSLRTNPPFGAAQMVKLCLEELLLLIGRNRATPQLPPARITLQERYEDPLVRDIVAYMQAHIAESISIAELCRRFSYGKTRLCTKFQDETGKSINRYFMEMKISAAKRIIREENGTRELFSRIADALGFSSPSYFYATFKRVTGMTPTQYFKSVHQYDFERDGGERREKV
jgi:AraC-like DNA-binding protein